MNKYYSKVESALEQCVVYPLIDGVHIEKHDAKNILHIFERTHEQLYYICSIDDTRNIVECSVPKESVKTPTKVVTSVELTRALRKLERSDKIVECLYVNMNGKYQRIFTYKVFEQLEQCSNVLKYVIENAFCLQDVFQHCESITDHDESFQNYLVLWKWMLCILSTTTLDNDESILDELKRLSRKKVDIFFP